MNSRLLILLCNLFAVLRLSVQQTSCTTDTNYKFMSTKTDYSLVANLSNFNDYSIPSKKFLFYLLKQAKNT